jgi:hypothetical protein
MAGDPTIDLARTSEVERRDVVITVDHRFIRADRSEVSITRLENTEVREFKTAPATVRRSFGVTLNQGNFESCRIDASVTVPCYLEDVERADEWARKFCEDRLRAEVLQIKPEKNKNPL